ncbi:MAG: cytochrome c biogenesis protein ResB [Elusimicrobia bacterium]|nr:cytochrome c biogenesis protein ResB [Elusimicrobiota bacterium]
MRRNDPLSRLVDGLSSLKLTLLCLALLMVLVVACTLAQVNLGIHLAVERFIRSFIVWWSPEGSALRLPVFPGGGLVGGVLLLNLIFAQFRRLELSWRKGGLWIVHIGLALLFIGEFATALMQVESNMAIEEGQTKSYSEDYRRMEVAVVDETDKEYDDEVGIPDSLLKSRSEISDAALPFTLRVHAYHDNAALAMRGPGGAPSIVTAGVGAGMSFSPLPPVTADDDQNTAVAVVEPVLKDGTSLGVYLLSNGLGAPQGFINEGRKWKMALRLRRYQHPFALTLKDFRHDVYPGTDIPKNFSSLVRLKDPRSGDDRDVLIYMNSPLRHGGLTFYQASFGKNDTLSVLQVVRNPAWTLPYLSCLLVALGLLWHFGMMLKKSLGARSV